MAIVEEVAPRELIDAPSACLETAWDSDFRRDGALTHAMVIAWFSRPDLRAQFDLRNAGGRRALRDWYLDQGRGGGGKRLMRRASMFARHMRSSGPTKGDRPGVNLVGYAQGVLGMGEHVRMSATAMMMAQIPSGIVDFTLGLGKRRQSFDGRIEKLRRPRHRCNLFHINADQMLRAYMHLGSRFFEGRYNIGYWAWELASWPAEWLPAIGTVDEIWAPSRFVQQAIAPVTSKPVQWMPLCVELPDTATLPRSEFGVSDEHYVFAFTFDCHSYFERKNPRAIVRAFKRAFPVEPRARLIIKTMNSDVCADAWQELLADVAGDERIRLFDEAWPRERVISLLACSDAYVSLHRSEGFGRGPAEAMLLGKPVIVTDYSGTTDFCRPDNAFRVDYSLVAVKPGSYVGAAGQVWADPSIDCAARHMRDLFDDRSLGPRIGAKGRQTILEEFSAAAIGRHYRARLAELGMIELE